MCGIVTIDDALQATRENADRDLQKLGGMEALDTPYLETGLRPMLRQRAGWLSALFLGEMLTATAMGFFEKEIANAVVLALFIPLIISSGGNSGSQATTLVIRAMALGEVRVRQWWGVLRREIVCGLGLGAVLCVIGMRRILLARDLGGVWSEFAQGASRWSAQPDRCGAFGTMVGAMLPLLLRTCRLDPASASAPAVATIVDVSGLIIYFSIAKLLMLGGCAGCRCGEHGDVNYAGGRRRSACGRSQAEEAALRTRTPQDLPRIRVRCRKVVPHARRGPPPPGTRTGRRRRRRFSRKCPPRSRRCCESWK